MNVQLLECTIRDGSNEVEFQWTADDVATMAAALDRAGFAYIEAGHGWALGANHIARTPQLMAREGKDITAALDDEAYFRVIRRVVKHATLGALFAPGALGGGVLGPEWVDMSADNGLGFMRLGIFPHWIEEGYLHAVIRRVKDRGMLMALNVLQTYLLTPEKTADLAARAVDLGADWFYVVDSAGCMVPDQVARYVEAVAKRCPTLRIGLHGHNNTQLAIANALAAIDAGATLIDTSLQGIGRPGGVTGNAPTETLLGILQHRRGMERHIDQDLVFRLGRTYVRPQLKQGFDPTHVLSGIAKIHSDRLFSIGAAAASHGLGIDDVLIEVGRSFDERGIVSSFSNDDAAATCKEVVAARGPVGRRTTDFGDLIEVLTDHAAPPADLASLTKQLRIRALRDRLKTALVFVRPSLWPLAGPSIVVRGGWAIGAMPSARVDLSTLTDVTWLRAVFADDQLPGVEGATPIAVRPFSVSRLVAEAATLAARAGGALIACDDGELARDLAGRLWRDEPTVLGAGDAVPTRALTSAYLQGARGRDALGSAGFRAALRPDTTIHLLGSEPFDAGTLGAVDLRLPDVWSLLRARATLEDGVQLVDGGAGAAPADQRALQVVPGSGEVLDPRAAAVLGRWAALAGRPDAAPATGAIRAMFADHIGRLFARGPVR